MRTSLLFLLGLTGCITHWQPQSGPPTLVVNRTTGTQFRVTRIDGSRVTVERPRIEGDSLIGFLEPMGPWPDAPARFAIPLSDIRAMDEKEGDLVASVAVGTLITLTILVLMARGIDQ